MANMVKRKRRLKKAFKKREKEVIVMAWRRIWVKAGVLMGSIRKMKRDQQPKPKVNYQLDLKLTEKLIFDRGFNAGAQEQRESDIECLVICLRAWKSGLGSVRSLLLKYESIF
jgi:hypothetical protein